MLIYYSIKNKLLSSMPFVTNCGFCYTVVYFWTAHHTSNGYYQDGPYDTATILNLRALTDNKCSYIIIIIIIIIIYWSQIINCDQ